MFHRKYSFLFMVVSAYALGDIDLRKLFQDGNNQFSGKMLSNFVEFYPENIVLSGFSVLTPLSLLEIASTGSTRLQLLNAIGLKNNSYILKVFSEIVNPLKKVEEIEFIMANKLLVNMNYQLNDQFDAVARDTFETEVINTDFSDANQVATEINDWVDKKTNHRIKYLMDPSNVDKNTRAVLVNALYFKGKWKLPFARQLTKAKTFYVDDETSVQVLMMHNTARYKYTESSKFNAKILEMSYIGDEASMVIVLPNEVEGINSLLEKLKNLNALDEEMKSMKLEKVNVIIPKFKIEASIDLKAVLQPMNVTEIFNERAQINRLIKSSEPLYVSDAIQKAFIEIDEKGSEAADANVFKVMPSSLRIPTDVKDFIADHPFVLFIKINDITVLSALYNKVNNINN